ncbi:hypothetical protein ACHHYP_09768 [Achlya hypogyna]|uniref:Uncharacterized protein n=1 Tax=Achlya hypogyna TaxID=1202772 RepID=A0A1V9YMI2_ACHHY|nr:hypothetical protein ACHHYP_09768 [Achlya hypogyna]
MTFCVDTSFTSTYFSRLPHDVALPEIGRAISLLKGRRAYLAARHDQIATAFAADDDPPMIASPTTPTAKHEFARLFHGNVAFENLKRQHAAINDKRVALSKSIEADHANDRERRPSDEYNELFEGTANSSYYTAVEGATTKMPSKKGSAAFTNCLPTLLFAMNKTEPMQAFGLEMTPYDLCHMLATLKQQRINLGARRLEVEASVNPPTVASAPFTSRDEFARLFVDNRIPAPRG